MNNTLTLKKSMVLASSGSCESALIRVLLFERLLGEFRPIADIHFEQLLLKFT